MSKVTQIKAEVKMLSPAELRHIRDWLDNFLEDKLAFPTEFESRIRESEREVSAGSNLVFGRLAASGECSDTDLLPECAVDD